ncbi:MAG: HEAT repeat domain-containing protein [Pirellulales bacterium]|nr:HEAT repeat domain-containing protein [Pirellulales bacterium]
MTNRRMLQAGVVAYAGALWLAAACYAELPAKQSEAQLIKALQTAAPAEKAIACKQLAIYGTAQCVPELAKLLGDPQLSSWSRTALEAIPEKAADQALVDALRTVKGRQLIGVINSLGVRRSAGAAAPLGGLIDDAEPKVAAAAAVALGRIGGPEATQQLRSALKSATDKDLKTAAAEGCILCAERLAAEGKGREAAEIFDEVRQSEASPQKTREATRGAILARGAEGVPLLVELLKSPDKHAFTMGLKTARELPGEAVIEALAKEVSGAPPERAALVLLAIAERPDAKLTESILHAAEQGDKAVRLAAISVIGRLGGAESAPTLLEAAVDGDEEISQAAIAATAGLQGDKVDHELVSRLSKAKGRQLAVLLRLVGERRIDAAAELKAALQSPDEAVREAALAALGETAGIDDLPVLIAQVVEASSDAGRDKAAQAVTAAAVRMPDRDACASKLASALVQAPPAAQVKLVETLGAVGGGKALETIAATVKGPTADLQDTGSRVLGEWMTADAAPVLLELAQDPACAKYQVRLLRGYLRIARQFVLPVDGRAEMCRQALAAARRPAEQQLVLEILERYPAEETLAVAAEATHVAGLEEAAHRAAIAILAQLASEGADVAALLANAHIQPVKVEIVKAEYGARETFKDVTDVLARHVGPVPMIALSGGYNKNFGGDPAPNTPKELRVQYRINGQDGQASFAENAPIILPMPRGGQ